MIPYVLVGVPIEAGLFEDKPVLSPFLGEVAFSVLLLPQPALAVAVPQILTRNSPSTCTSEGTYRETEEVIITSFWIKLSLQKEQATKLFVAYLQ